MPRWTPLVALSLLLLASAATAQQEAPAQAPEPILYLEPWPDIDTPGNFTSLAPTQDHLPVRSHRIAADTQRIHWDWWLGELPSSWTIQEGATVDVVLYISNLEWVVPAADLLEHRDSLGEAKLIARIDHLGSREGAAQGSVVLPSGPDVGMGETVEVRIRMTAPRTLFYPMQAPPGVEPPLFGLNVTLVGVASNRVEFSPTIHVDAASPSRVRVAGFPIVAFRAWEDSEAAEKACNDALLRGEECMHADPSQEPATQVTPPVGTLAAPAAMLLLLAILRRSSRRRRHVASSNCF